MDNSVGHGRQATVKAVNSSDLWPRYGRLKQRTKGSYWFTPTQIMINGNRLEKGGEGEGNGKTAEFHVSMCSYIICFCFIFLLQLGSFFFFFFSVLFSISGQQANAKTVWA